MSETRVRAEFQVNNLDRNSDPVFVRTDGSVQMLNDLDANTFKIVNLGTPTNSGDLINKEYMELFFEGLDQKESARVATTDNVDLNAAPELVDGVATKKDDRVLVRQQDDPVENGIYTVVEEATSEPSTEDVFQSTSISDPSIAVEQISGSPDKYHYAFVDESTGDIRYALYENNSWSVEVVANLTGSIDIALESDGTPHIIAEVSGTQYHFVKSSGSWISMSGFTSPTLYRPSIDIDSNGVLHVSGIEGGSSGNLGYANKQNTTWAQSTVDSGANAKSNDIVVDSAGNLHVAYRDDSIRSGKYAFYDGTWATEEYGQSDVNDGRNCGIDVDGADNPHISHFGAYKVWHSFNDGAWNTEEVHHLGEMAYDGDLSNSLNQMTDTESLTDSLSLFLEMDSTYDADLTQSLDGLTESNSLSDSFVVFLLMDSTYDGDLTNSLSQLSNTESLGDSFIKFAGVESTYDADMTQSLDSQQDKSVFSDSFIGFVDAESTYDADMTQSLDSQQDKSVFSDTYSIV